MEDINIGSRNREKKPAKMIREIAAWKCTVCKKIMTNSKEVEEHEKLPVVGPLPRGFVYLDISAEEYRVVRSARGKRLENHDYEQEVVRLDSSGAKLSRCYGTDYERARCVRCYLGSGYYYGRLFARFEKFKVMYSRLDTETRKRIGLQAKDLTNKL